MKKRLLATRVFFLAVTAAVILLAALSFARGEGVRLSAVTAAAVPLAAFFATFIPQIGRKDAKRLEKAAQPYMGRAFDGHGKESRLFLRAFAFWQQGKNGEAEAAALRLYRTAEDSGIRARALFLAGRCLLEEGEAREAADRFEEALRFDPSMAMAWSNLATACDKMGEAPQTMVRCLENAVFYEPDYEIAYGKLGLYYSRLDEAEKSEQAFRTAVRLNPRRAQNHANLSWILLSSGRLDEAEAAYRRALACGYQDNGALRRMLMQAKTDPSPGGAGEC